MGGNTNSMNLKNVSLYLRLLLLMVLALTAGRCYFFFRYHEIFASDSAGDLLLAFLNGLRFDLATSATMTIPFWVILFFPGVPRGGLVDRVLLKLLLGWYLVLACYIFIDVEYYSFAQRHLTFEVRSALGEITPLLKIGVTRYLPQVIGLLFFQAFYLWGCLRVMRQPPLDVPSRGLVCRALVDLPTFVLITLVSVLLIRGGIQMRPLAVNNAFASDKVELGILSLNGPYSTFKALRSGQTAARGPQPHRPVDVTPFILGEKTETTLKAYPLFRSFPYAPSERRPYNVVILVMESWSAKFVGSLGGEPSATPFFDRLSKEGLLLTNCFANAQRSVEGLTAILDSSPQIEGLSDVLMSQTRNEPGVSIFKKMGYSSYFMHGAKFGSMGLHGFAARQGFQRYISRNDMTATAENDDGVWGIYDEPFFLRANQEFARSQEPFLSTVFSLSSHTPYTLPSPEYKHFGKEVPHADFLNALRYSDHALETFFKAASKEPYFERTLFVIIGDHTEGHSTVGNLRDCFRIPCLFYSPALVKPARFDRVASQVDVMPTVFDLLKIGEHFTSWGKSVLSPGERRALLPLGNLHVWADDEYLMLANEDQPLQLYSYRQDQARKNLIGAQKPGARETRERLFDEMGSYLKLTWEMVLNNRVVPGEVARSH